MRRRGKRKGSFGKIFTLVVLFGIVGGLVYLYNSAMFEQTKPSIEVEKELYWNFKNPIPISVYDASGVRFIRVTLSDGNSSILLANATINGIKKKVKILAKYPRTAFFDEKSKLSLNIEATDNSKWNFFMGNEIKISVPIKIDVKKPKVKVVANSYSITQGGSASVVFGAKDENLEKLYIQAGKDDIFKPVPFYKDGYFISLVVWRYNQKKFSANIIAVDKAGNETKKRIKFYPLSHKYRTSYIKASDNFINGKITDLVEEYAEEDVDNMDNLAKFKFINETLRNANEDKIHKLTKLPHEEKVSKFFLKPFYPLKNAAAVASFGDHRYYTYKGKKVSESYHLGLDLASTSMANIRSSNKGLVIHAEDNGIYGKNIIISHGLGVYTIYGHCSSMDVEEGDEVRAGQVIGKTGLTGLALGDHVHFGTLVQGIEVRPEEWMDKKWFSDNVLNVIKDAKKIISKKY